MTPSSETGAPAARRRHALATVCLSGELEDKLGAAAAAGFDGVEVFEPDLLACAATPGEVRARCDDLGLSIELYQPFRDLDSTDPAARARSLRRLRAKGAVMADLGVDTLLVCSSVAADAVRDPDELAAQLSEAADAAAESGLRLAYEALAWGRWVSTWEASWDVVARADHPALGLCLDSFHVLSRGGDPAGFAAVPAEKLFFLQLADAPHLSMDVLQWSRHHRLFPGQGAFDLPAFVDAVLDAGYTGPLSLEVFNDVFRQADPRATARDARRSLLALEEQLAHDPLVLPAAPALLGHAFTELAVDAASHPVVAGALGALGFTRTGQRRGEAVELWEQGEGPSPARVVLDASRAPAEGAARVSAVGLECTDPEAALARAAALLAPAGARPSAVGAPDGTEVALVPVAAAPGAGWASAFVPTGAVRGRGAGLTRTDHVSLTQPFDAYDEAASFYRAVLGLVDAPPSELAAPFGLVRGQPLVSPDRGVRVALSASLLRRGQWRPGTDAPQHVAFATDDAVATARALRAAGAPLLRPPPNYHDDVAARHDLAPALLADLRELGLFYDADASGAFLHLYTELLGGRVFFEVAQRTGASDGYGAVDAPVRMAAHRRARRERETP